MNYSISLCKHKHAEALNQLLNSKSSEIPPYNRDLIIESKEIFRGLLNELRALMKIQKQEDLPEDSDVRIWRRIKTGTLYDDYARIKRFLLIFMSQRFNKIEYHFWSFGGNVKEQQQNNLADHEKNYLVKYKQLLMSYIKESGVNINSDLQPPFQVNVEVKVVRQYGEIINQNGDVIKLLKGSVHFIPKNFIEHLIGQGYLQII